MHGIPELVWFLIVVFVCLILLGLAVQIISGLFRR